ncbi:Chloride/fluoride channel protein [Fundidesulfovibrio magnetotacticus]|uniref:Chloride/fluoride channel protein n=1 Tax=Fundidesulfovibrio magnetotacticus TaxID=2730080 RepID=A0A6V8LZ42_9BACT|nr:chloride channel protein [Fundidesulfovibrio magnetotacticus]GFK94917.1 Chloride/fluoride channel protein [Fundidesulfovibrio magnetotacticus]
MLTPLKRFFGSRRLRRVLLFVGVGAATGLLAVAYSFALEVGSRLIQGGLLGLHEPTASSMATLARPWLLPVITTLVGAFTGVLVGKFLPEAQASGTDGTDAMIRAFHQGQGRIPPRAAALRTATSVLTIASGGSAGKEGPVAFLGAGFGSWLAGKFGLTDRDRRVLLLAGAAGGLGAIFRSPLGGAMTAVEVLYSEDFEGEALLPCIVSSVTAYLVCTFFYGTQPILHIPDPRPATLREIPFYLLLAAACAGSAWLYVRGFFFIKYKVFRPLGKRFGLAAATAAGGLAMGLVGMAFPDVTGSSHASLELAVLGQIPAMTLAALLLGKIVATSLTIGSGFSGGMFAPGLFVGAMTGGLAGKLLAFWRADLAPSQGAFVLVGMSAFFACAANAPLGPLIMVCEISQGYALLAPLMLCTAVALLLSGRFCLYENQLRGKVNSPAHRGEAAEAALRQLRVADAYTPGRVAVLEEGTTLGALPDIIAGTENITFPVRGEGGRITGLVTLADVRRVLFESALYPLVVARDLARPAALLTPGQDLHEALLLFVEAGVHQLPVVDPADRDVILGALTLRDLQNAQRDRQPTGG